MSRTEPEQKKQRASPRKRHWTRWVLAVLLAVMSTHTWWLSVLGEFLLAEEARPHADVALVIGGDHRMHEAAKLMSTSAVSQIWLIERDPSYAVEAGILPADHDMALEQLECLGVPAKDIRLLEGHASQPEHVARIVDRELRLRPETEVVILCQRSHGRNVQTVFADVLRHPANFSVMGLPADEYDEHNWWRSRTGWKETFIAFSDLMFTLTVGVETNAQRSRFDPDAYEQALNSRFGEVSCHAD